jgi:hypothetical protein
MQGGIFSMSLPKYCTNCGARIEDEDTRFCSECGSPVEPDSSAEPAETTPSEAEPAAAAVSENAAAENTVSENVPVKKRKFLKIFLMILIITACTGIFFGVKFLFFKEISIGSPVKFAGSNVLYLNKNYGNRLYKMNSDGSVKVKLDNEYTIAEAADGDWIYYGGFTLYKIQKDGSSRTKLDDVWIGSVAAADGWVYYTNDYGDDRSIFKIGTDGKNKSRLNNDFSTDITKMQTTISGCTKSDPMAPEG